MPIWLGNPGRQAELPSPVRGLDPTLQRPSSVRQTIGGGQVVSRAPGPGRRTYQASWAYIDIASFSVLEQMFTGTWGVGPHALVDPARRNMLTANQSSGGALGDATGYTVDPTELVEPSTALLYGAAGSSMRWSLPDASTSGILRLDPPSGIPGIPAPANLPWTFSVRLAGGGNDGTVTVTPALQWMDATGMPVGVTLGAPVAVIPGVWTPGSVTASVPAGACLQPMLLADLTTVSASPAGPGDIPVRRSPWTMPVKRAAAVGPLPKPINLFRPAGVYAAELYLAQPQLDMADTVRDWVLGTGVPRVSVTELPESYAAVLPDRVCNATFVEVG